MPKFMDVHDGFVGVTKEQFDAAHAADVAIQHEEGVSFDQAWLDPVPVVRSRTGTPGG